MEKTRLERDSFGVIEVANQRLWGAQTQRSLTQFRISTEKMPIEFIRALALTKKACILTNTRLNLLDKKRSDHLLIAVDEVLEGRWDDEFPLSIWQTGSATQTNMNMNEVIANRAIQIMGGTLGNDHFIHPNDDVNLGQSSNDVIPTAMHVAALHQIQKLLFPAIDNLIATIDLKALQFSHIIKVGRTHLQDAVPLTLGQEFSGYASQVRLAREAIALSMPMLSELALGGTAVGTGINAHPLFGRGVVDALNSLSGSSFKKAANPFAALAGHEPMVFAHGGLKTLATALMKISTDIRWMASGPRSGLGEITIPENEPGSSIMPGKVNPTQCEAMAMICCQVLANDTAIAMGGASGNFELNVFKPLILHNFFQSIRLLVDGINSFEQYCVRGIVPNESKISQLMNNSLMLVTALTPHIGYDKASVIAKLAHRKNITLKSAAIESGYVTGAEFDQWVNPGILIK